jgi:2-(1,2-epoxy-1,2-dihydrophenyl)acetyl-CoA isomerase
MQFRNLILEKKDGVGILSLNKPEVRNAIDMETRNEFLSALSDVEIDPWVKVVVIRGMDGHFTAGGSINDIKDSLDVWAGRSYCVPATKIVKKIFHMEKPVIAAVDGYAVGAGLSLVFASDLAIASDRALFSEVFIRIGLTPDYGSCYFLPRVVGIKKAKELAFTGRMIQASEALALGIVNKVVPSENLWEEVQSLANSLVRGPTKTIGLTKHLLNLSLESSLETMFELELMATSICFQTEDHREGIQAFLDKRQPDFKGK